MSRAHEQKMIAYVADCDDPDKLRTIANNAQIAGATELFQRAKRRLFAILPSEEPGTLAYEVWRSIFALEEALKEERGKTVLLSRTRQKIKAQGEHRCVADLVSGKRSEGFDMLLQREMLDLSFEAVALRFPDEFPKDVLLAAEERLKDVGYQRG